jgi:UDP-2-acetamido-2,6-beta-L-arabino-hexul-4-ose reductase
MKTNVLVTGGEGFIGKNLRVRLAERGCYEVRSIDVGSGPAELVEAVAAADIVVHLAGVNRPEDEADFMVGNRDAVVELTRAVQATARKIPILLSSSIQAVLDNPYGRSKRAGEEALLAFAAQTGNPAVVLRLPNVFGKWAAPNYNSAVATFCHRIAHGQEITVHDPKAALSLIYVDDLIDRLLEFIDGALEGGSGYREVWPVHQTTVGEVAAILRSFASSRGDLSTAAVGVGLTRALYATYLTYLEPADFAYDVPIHADPRGVFVEMLKTADSGQFSYFTAGPGVTRGDHYHHTKAEKFLVLLGKAHFGFRHILTGAYHDLVVEGGQGRIVETIPGWTHNITNIGDTEMVVMLWASEIFDHDRPDTIARKVGAAPSLAAANH